MCLANRPALPSVGRAVRPSSVPIPVLIAHHSPTRPGVCATEAKDASHARSTLTCVFTQFAEMCWWVTARSSLCQITEPVPTRRVKPLIPSSYPFDLCRTPCHSAVRAFFPPSQPFINQRPPGRAHGTRETPLRLTGRRRVLTHAYSRTPNTAHSSWPPPPAAPPTSGPPEGRPPPPSSSIGGGDAPPHPTRVRTSRS